MGGFLATPPPGSFSLMGARRNTQEGRPEVTARTGPNVDRASPAAPGQSRVTARIDESTSFVSRSDLLRLQRTAGNSAVSALLCKGTSAPPYETTGVLYTRNGATLSRIPCPARREAGRAPEGAARLYRDHK